MRAGRERRLVTTALVLGMFLAALEATAVGTAMPTVVAELGGVDRYSWVFSIYLLAVTVTIPVYGKLADLYGRRTLYLAAVGIFVLGSALSGMAQTLEQLIFFRAVQGIGAGGVLPLAVTLIGDIYSLEERARIQGLFAGVWGVSSLIGPAVGGLLTELVSWRWVFYFNLPFGVASAVALRLYLRETKPMGRRALDLRGMAMLTTALVCLLIALQEADTAWGWSSPATIGLLTLALACAVLFLRRQVRAPEPLLPLDLFRNRVIAVASVGSVVVGTLLFATSAYVPMFAQGVLGGSARDAAVILASMSVGWPVASTLAGRLILRFGYRPVAVIGGALGVAGSLMLAGADAGTGHVGLMSAMLLIGLGLGFMSTPYLVAVQNAVPWDRRGVATSSIQFFRTIGGAVAVAAFGALLTRSLTVAGITDPSAAMSPELREQLAPETLAELTAALGQGLHWVYLAFALVAGAGLVAALVFPSGAAAAHAYRDPLPGDHNG